MDEQGDLPTVTTDVPAAEGPSEPVASTVSPDAARSVPPADAGDAASPADAGDAVPPADAGDAASLADAGDAASLADAGGAASPADAGDGPGADAGRGDGEDDAAYLARVRREIDEEVRRRRAAGDFLPSFERKLDELFARYTPTGEDDDAFAEALKLADRAAFFDIDVPVGSRREPRGLVKWTLWQAEAWFVRYVVDQLNHFSAAAMRVLHLLDERLQDIERDVALVVGPGLEEEPLTEPADPRPFADALVARLRAGAGGRRVLHAECGDGALLAALHASGVDAYGVDPGSQAADLAVRSSLDVRRDDVIGHLRAVAPGALGGVVLAGAVDRTTVAHRRRMVDLAVAAVAPGGVVAVVATHPDAWESRVGPVAADLASGRPWHAETWAAVLTQAGLADATVLTPAGQDGGACAAAAVVRAAR
jgi:hypothetical protein